MLLRKFIVVSIAFTGLLSLTACNTISGVGKDISTAGTAIENAAEKNKKKKK